MIKIYRHTIKNPTKIFCRIDKPIPKIYRKEKQAQDKAKKFLEEDKNWGQCEASEDNACAKVFLPAFTEGG